LSLGALFTLGLSGSAFAIIPAYACGPDSDCMLGQRTYRIQMPETSGGKKPLGAIIFAHGYRGSAAGLMKNKGLSRTIADMGLVFVAPKSAGEDWDIPNAPNPGNNLDFAYFKRLKKELVQRHGVDGDRIMVSGFSAGGMMVWNLACRLGDTFAAYAPIAGTFWAPVPEACPAMPVPLIHIHGTSDKIVPLKGRPIGSTRQGDVYRALKMAAAKGGLDAWKSVGIEDSGVGEGDGSTLACQERKAQTGEILRFCVHPGGHSMRAKWVAQAWNVFQETGAIKP